MATCPRPSCRALSRSPPSKGSQTFVSLQPRHSRARSPKKSSNGAPPVRSMRPVADTSGPVRVTYHHHASGDSSRSSTSAAPSLESNSRRRTGAPEYPRIAQPDHGAVSSRNPTARRVPAWLRYGQDVLCLYLTRWLLMGNGRMSISAGSVEFRASGKVLVDTAPEIGFRRARVPALFMRSTPQLTGQDGQTLSVWPVFRLRATRRELTEAGFTLHDRMTWLAPAPSPRSRR